MSNKNNARATGARKAELHIAYMFDCDECGAENFVRGVRVELSQNEMEFVKDFHNIVDEDCLLTQQPSEVTCKACGAHFYT